MSVALLAAVAALGAIGAVLRVVVAGTVQHVAGRPFPVGTLAVNVVGCLAAGVVAETVAGDARLVVAGGLLASLTTFSTLAVDVVVLAADGRRRAAALDLGMSLGLGLAALAAGVALGRLG